MATKLTKKIAYLWLFLLLGIVVLCGPVVAEDKARPVVLVFQVDKADKLSDAFATSVTRALRNYYRETQRVEATIFDRESPAVKRAILDKKFTADSVATYSTKEQRVSAANILGFEYASGAEVTFDTAKGIDGKVLKLKVWLVDVNGRKASWEASSVGIYQDTNEFDLENAMQSATSKAVIDVTRQAFAKLPVITDAQPISGDESIAVGGAKTPEVKQPDSSDYSSNAEESLSEGNLAVAIQEYSHAVNADPTNGPLRIKLALTYAKKQMYKEAVDALNGALEIGADKKLVDDARQKVELMRGGQSVAVDQPKAQEQPKQVELSPSPVIQEQIKLTNDATAAAVVKLVEGDKLWKKGDPDGAAKSYAEAIKLNPKDWRSYERLAVVNASMSLFSESRFALEQLKVVQPNPPATVIATRYEILRKAFDKSFTTLLNQYEDDTADYASKKITRESYYNTINGLALRSESMAKFVDAVTVPTLKEAANIHRSLACGLFAQASSSMLDYLISNSAQSKTNAQTFIDQAKKELQAAAEMDGNRVVIKQDQTQDNTPEPPAASEEQTSETQANPEKP